MAAPEGEKVIRLDDIFYILKKHKKIIAGFALIGFLVGVLISFAYYVKGVASVKYYVTASIAVSSANQNGLFTQDSVNPNSQDIHLAEDMTDSVIYVCKSDKALNAAAEELRLIGVTAEDIKPNLTLSQYQETQIVEMTLVWDNAEEGMMILNAITKVVPDILQDTLKIGDVNVVNDPKVSTSYTSFLNIKLIAIVVLLAAMAGAGFYIIKHFIHPTYLHSEDIQRDLHLDVLAEIPKDNYHFDSPVNSAGMSNFSSTYKCFTACAHVLVHRLQDLNNVCLYITSSASQEGKTSITANLAYAISKIGYKTLVADMDLRNPTLSSKFKYEPLADHYFNNVYRGEVEPLDAVIHINDNLDLLPAKVEGERAVMDEKFQEIIASMLEHYDFVILDTPPVGQVSDAMGLNQIADCSLFVVRQDQVWVDTVQDSLERLNKSGIDTLGVIVNDTQGGADTYYYYNYKEFGDSPYVYVRDAKSANSRKKKDSSNYFRKLGKVDGAHKYYEEIDANIKAVNESRKSSRAEEEDKHEEHVVNSEASIIDKINKKRARLKKTEEEAVTESLEEATEAVDVENIEESIEPVEDNGAADASSEE